jgi:hypothetical protein
MQFGVSSQPPSHRGVMSIRSSRLLLPVLSAVVVTSLPAQSLRRQPIASASMAIGSPTGVTASYGKGGVLLTWQGVAGAVQYQVHRGADEKSLVPVATIPAEQLSWMDQGVNAPVMYKVMAVSARGAVGASTAVAYAPPAALERSLPTGLTKGTFNGIKGMAPGVPPLVTSLNQPPAGAAWIRNGQSMVVTGTGLDGLTGVWLVETWYYGGGFKAGGGYDPPGWYVHANATAHPVTPTGLTSTSFSIVPQVPTPPLLQQSTTYKVIVAKGTWIDTSDVKIDIAGALPVRKITGVVKRVIRSGARVDVIGVGLDQASAGYFGTGVKGSVTNPMLNIWNRGATGLQLETTAACDQEGFIELDQTALPGEPAWVSATPPITVTCVPQTPYGTVVGSTATNYLPVLPGAKITIQGKYLKHVTRVLTNVNESLPFTYSKAGNIEMLSVTLPSPTEPVGKSFFLENVLTDPVVPGQVTGGVAFMFPPTFYSIWPTWAEAGQMVRVSGHNIKYAGPIQVTVGGVPAQVVTATALNTTFRLGAGTTAGPIEIQNEAGKTALTGPFQAQTAQQHPGFFVVSGPSVVTQIVVPPGLAYNSVITVHGQNLARLGGICLPSAGAMGMPPGPVVLKRLGSGGSDLGAVVSNTVMQVTLTYQPSAAAPGPVMLYAPTQPPGDQVIADFACTANGGVGVNWP